MSVTALIVAAGKGERLGGAMPKQYRSIGGKPVLRRAVEPFLNHAAIGQIPEPATSSSDTVRSRNPTGHYGLKSIFPKNRKVGSSG